MDRNFNVAAAGIVDYVVVSFPRLGLPSFGHPGENDTHDK
jgi:hypothetical protein